jgi:uncharacterized protein YneF (UPF0154 family)
MSYIITAAVSAILGFLGGVLFFRKNFSKVLSVEDSVRKTISKIKGE